MDRRFFLQLMATASSSILVGKSLTSCSAKNRISLGVNTSSTLLESAIFLPDEGDVHACTWMAFGPSAEIWGSEYLSAVQDDLAAIARTIARYEPVKMLVRQADYEVAQSKCDPAVELIVCPIDDLWMRDMGPVFVIDEAGQKAAIDFNFNGWGEKQEHDRDAGVARFVAQQSQALLINTPIVFEGGGIEVDGRGSAIITESCILNDNRNPGLSKADCEAELKALLGLKKIIWLPGIAGYDITDGHTDFYARFVRSGVVAAGFEPNPDSFDHAVTRRHLEILQSATDAEGRPLEVVVIEGPSRVRPGYASDEFAAGYINFYVLNGAVIAPEFGDELADRQAKERLTQLFPNREIVQINIDNIAAGGRGHSLRYPARALG